MIFGNEEKSKVPKLPTLEEMRERFGLDELKKKYENKGNVKFNNNQQNIEEVKKMKRELVGGQKNILNRVYPPCTSSVYKETFKGFPDKFKLAANKHDNTSGVKGKIPDPYEINRVFSHRQINSALKGNVRNILFK
jgi:hypothetical protein